MCNVNCINKTNKRIRRKKNWYIFPVDVYFTINHVPSATFLNESKTSTFSVWLKEKKVMKRLSILPVHKVTKTHIEIHRFEIAMQKVFDIYVFNMGKSG